MSRKFYVPEFSKPENLRVAGLARTTQEVVGPDEEDYTVHAVCGECPYPDYCEAEATLQEEESVPVDTFVLLEGPPVIQSTTLDHISDVWQGAPTGNGRRYFVVRLDGMFTAAALLLLFGPCCAILEPVETDAFARGKTPPAGFTKREPSVLVG